MADLGRILYLPPPVPPSAAQPATLPGRSGARAPVETTQRSVAPGIEDDTTASSGGRIRQFRFRVYDGGRPEETLAGDNGLPARRGGDAQEETTAGATARRGASAGDPVRTGSGRDPASGTGTGTATGLATPSSAFLAQLIAQEQLRPGLHDPPLRDADRAYRRAGGEPALGDESNAPLRARFKLAV